MEQLMAGLILQVLLSASLGLGGEILLLQELRLEEQEQVQMQEQAGPR